MGLACSNYLARTIHILYNAIVKCSLLPHDLVCVTQDADLEHTGNSASVLFFIIFQAGAGDKASLYGKWLAVDSDAKINVMLRVSIHTLFFLDHDDDDYYHYNPNHYDDQKNDNYQNSNKPASNCKGPR